MVSENIGDIQIIGSENQFEGKKLIMQLFYWLTFSATESTKITNQLDSINIRDKRIAPYFKTILLLNKVKT